MNLSHTTQFECTEERIPIEVGSCWRYYLSFGAGDGSEVENLSSILKQKAFVLDWCVGNLTPDSWTFNPEDGNFWDMFVIVHDVDQALRFKLRWV